MPLARFAPAARSLVLYLADDGKVVVHAAPAPLPPSNASGAMLLQRQSRGNSPAVALTSTMATTSTTVAGSVASVASSGASTASASPSLKTTSTLGDQRGRRQRDSPNPFKESATSRGGTLLVFSPVDGSFHVDSQYDDYTPTLEACHTELRIHGLIGLLDLGHVKLLFYIKRRQHVADIGDRAVYRVVEGGHVAVCRRPFPTLADEQQEAEGIQSILSVLASGLLHFSYDHDLTNNMQRLFVPCAGDMVNDDSDEEDAPMPLHANVNRNFWWNEFLLRPLLASDDNREFVLPVMCGYVGHLATALPFTRLAGIDRLNTSNGTSKDSRPTSPLSDTTDVEMEVDILLISRIHRQRVGTRYTRRGLDDMGFAANFVETELVVMTEKDVASFVQARGSVPWLWQQETDLSYKPAIELESLASERATIAFINHVDYLELEYSQGRVTLINLLNKQGYERPLADAYNYAYQNYLKDSANVDYHHFDLNEKPRSKAKETWRQLFHTIKTAVNEQGFLCARAAPVNSWPWFDPSSRDRFARKRNMGEYMANGPPSSSSVDLLNAGDGSRANTTILRTQTGVTRINCLDCLDRTNMIEYVVGTRALMLMLAELGVSTVPPQREWHEEDYHVTDVRRALGSRGLELYRLMWFQNGNAIAQQYTGTGALNSQFITTGHHHCSHNRFSVASKVMDGFHAMGRYYLNNFVDNYRQDDYDLFLGNHRGGVEAELTADDYAKSQQRRQRRLSFTLSSSPPNETTCLNYLLLAHRYAGPRELRTWFQYTLALIWLLLLSVWWLLFVRLGVQNWVPSATRLPFVGGYFQPGQAAMARLRRLNASAPQQKRIEGGEGKASRDEQDDVIYTIQWRRPKSGITNWDGDDAPLVDV